MANVNPMNPMMACGHSANAVDGEGRPVCVICAGLNAGAGVVAPEPDLCGRISRCAYCKKERTSGDREFMAFFEHRPKEEFDRYYCGCRGWN
jgi:hypothetical protein